MSVMRYCVIRTRIGELLLGGDAKRGLRMVSFQDGVDPVTPDHDWAYDEKPFRDAISQLEDYFTGSRRKFTLKLNLDGTVFQKKVWKQLQAIPYGRTVSYGQIAQAIGNPRASRAVGAANGKNPLSIVIPCHRVIGSTGRLVGFSSGIRIKEALLRHEQRCRIDKPSTR